MSYNNPSATQVHMQKAHRLFVHAKGLPNTETTKGSLYIQIFGMLGIEYKRWPGYKEAEEIISKKFAELQKVN